MSNEVKRFRIKAKHYVWVTYEVEGEGFDKALEHLLDSCEHGVFTEFGESLVGPNSYVMDANNIKHIAHEFDYEHIPHPTMSASDWDWFEVDDEDE